jgi:tetratricopeptide (TPR) repeat protein
MAEEMRMHISNAPNPEPSGQDDLRKVLALWERYGSLVLTFVLVVFAAVLVTFFFRRQKLQARQEAVALTFNARTVGELRQVVTDHAGEPVAPLAVLKVAKAAFTAGEYQTAMEHYREFIRAYPEHPLLPAAKGGYGQTLEALGMYQDALNALRSTRQAYPDHFLVPELMLSEARCLAALGQAEAARMTYEDLMVAHPDTAWAYRAEDALSGIASGAQTTPIPAPGTDGGSRPATGTTQP